jgi:hypothetical protein
LNIILTRISEILSLSVVTGDKAYDREEDNHVLIRERLHAINIITARYDDDLPICRTREGYRKQMRRHSKVLYNQRNTDKTIISVIKRLFGEHLMSRLIKTQNRELSFRSYSLQCAQTH